MQLTSIVVAAAVSISLRLIPFVTAEVGVHCGTTSDATLSDCQALVNDQAAWNAAFNTGNTCTYTNPLDLPPKTAWNVACKGNCCVYVAGVTGGDVILSETTRQEAAGLLGCGDPSKNSINGMQKFDDGHGVCLSNGDGCGDCFDDSDFI
ncbi:hypothetical protein Moror_17067 [Moniliophthora roreri MCA 2997]|uniref:Secreted protein n=2 Tax=Moniliophthora roreri TaxID=221103 RepID=V2X8P2_MONRO|nr:hypothetical protein Moror_17067 [Moniliophthora roreri MCA 2997]KAI3605531.1 hypothetical protein WG66_005994 [Moniliophthora roreri]